jgi:hypothetical protein
MGAEEAYSIVLAEGGLLAKGEREPLVGARRAGMGMLGSDMWTVRKRAEWKCR